ncbi:MAG: leucine-rich repeat domain-containing protein [Clostridiales bacterium]|nr:leucine-rich repeat domain-containing protein [Clostridiales bacterium]
MKKSRKIILAGLAALMLAGTCVLTACSDDDNKGEQEHTHKYVNYVCDGCGSVDPTAQGTEGLIYTEIEDNGTVIGYSVTSHTNLSFGDEEDGEPDVEFTPTQVIVPATHDGKPVLEIAKYAFYERANITSIIIADGVTKICDAAFGDCVGLVNVAMGNGVKEIGEMAFGYCTSLQSIKIPKSVESIGRGAFYGFRGIAGISVYSGNTNYKSTGNCLIETAEKTLIWGNKNSVIPTDGSVENIGFYAFYRSEGLTAINIPNTVKSIGEGAFEECGDLLSVNIPDSVKAIGEYAFFRCSSMTSITFGKGLTSIGRGAFSTCNSLQTITVASGNTKYHSSGNCLIETATKTLLLGGKNAVLPTDGSIAVIAERAFQNRGGWSTLVIPDSVTEIGSEAFYGSDLTSIKMGVNVTKIGEYAFGYNNDLTSIEFDGSKEEWAAITKEADWKYETGEFTVTCNNGTLSKSEC